MQVKSTGCKYSLLRQTGKSSGRVIKEGAEDLGNEAHSQVNFLLQNFLCSNDYEEKTSSVRAADHSPPHH